MGSHARKVVEYLRALFRTVGGPGASYALNDDPDRVHVGAVGLDAGFAPRIWLGDEITVDVDPDAPLGMEGIRLRIPVRGVYPAGTDTPGERNLCGLDGMSDLLEKLSQDRTLGELVYYATLVGTSYDGAQLDQPVDFGVGDGVITAWWETERGF